MTLDGMEKAIATKYHASKSGKIDKGNSNREKEAWKQEELIDAPNTIIRGWSNYHRTVVSKKLFNNMDHRMWNMLWKWGKRRHPHKSRTWVARKYWHTERSRNWVFFTERNRLKLFSDTKIVRHTSLRLDKKPYLDSEYFKLRKLRQNALKMTDRCKTRWDKLKDSSCA
jgi:RNA-directed DNA polymerase